MKKLGIYGILLGMFCFPTLVMAQDSANDVVVLDDGFQDYFFDAIMQKGIEYYDKAIEA